jgi:hypothetical protein
MPNRGTRAWTSEQRGDVAQLGERYVRNVQARGSNPLISTIFLS